MMTFKDVQSKNGFGVKLTTDFIPIHEKTGKNF